jgi:superoxide reductase
MADKYGVYKCDICGNVVFVIEDGAGDLVCCGEEMKKLEEKTAAVEGKEKHVPVLEFKGNKVTVKVGSIPHPMEQKHFIAMIQLMKNGQVLQTKSLKAGEKPEAEFYVESPDGLSAREYCNLHGLWKS